MGQAIGAHVGVLRPSFGLRAAGSQERAQLLPAVAAGSKPLDHARPRDRPSEALRPGASCTYAGERGRAFAGWVAPKFEDRVLYRVLLLYGLCAPLLNRKVWQVCNRRVIQAWQSCNIPACLCKGPWRLASNQHRPMVCKDNGRDKTLLCYEVCI